MNTSKVTLNTERFSGIFQVPQIFPIVVVGAGGIGADTILTAAKMGFSEIVAYDGDTVDDVNIATQFHRFSDIGRTKVAAVRDAVEEYAGGKVISRPEIVDRFTRWPFPVEVVISAVDSISARQEIFEAVIENYRLGNGPTWYIDCRMAAMEFHMFSIDMRQGKTLDQYYADLMRITDDDIEPLPCTEKATTFCSKAAAAYAGTELMHIVQEKAQSRFLVHNLDTYFTYTRLL